jgi:hypothetical protein
MRDTVLTTMHTEDCKPLKITHPYHVRSEILEDVVDVLKSWAQHVVNKVTRYSLSGLRAGRIRR